MNEEILGALVLLPLVFILLPVHFQKRIIQSYKESGIKKNLSDAELLEFKPKEIEKKPYAKWQVFIWGSLAILALQAGLAVNAEGGFKYLRGVENAAVYK